jgi:oligoendopeptidase F
MTAAGASGDAPTWDLSDLLGCEDIGAPAAIASALAGVQVLLSTVSAAKGTGVAHDPARLVDLLGRLGEIEDLLQRIEAQSRLLLASDTADASTATLNDATVSQVRELRAAAWFVRDEWSGLPSSIADAVMRDPIVASWRGLLKHWSSVGHHRLSHREEQLLAERRLSGPEAFRRMYLRLISGLVVGEAEHSLPFGRALDELGSPVRSARQRAANSIGTALGERREVLANILDGLVVDRLMDLRQRDYADWHAPTRLEHAVSQHSVETLIDRCRARYDIAHRWYETKADLMGLDRLADHDRMAPALTDDSAKRYTWADARALVVEAHGAIAPGLADAADRFFTERWIDARPSPDKQSGGFCEYTAPSVHPYISVSWTGTLLDVVTLAHEVGHGVHGLLSAGKGPLLHHAPVPLAETMSVAAEVLVLERLLALAEDGRNQSLVCAAVADNLIALTFRQVALHSFEHDIHEIRCQGEELTPDILDGVWSKHQAELFGGAVEINPGFERWWAAVPHLFVAPGYVYSYAFGQLVALSLLEVVRAGDTGEMARFLNLVSAGGSDETESLLRAAGCDTGDPGFWDRALDAVDRHIVSAGGEPGSRAQR